MVRGAAGAAALVLVAASSASAQRPVDWDALAQEAAQLLSAYIRINTTNPPGNEPTAAAFLRRVLEREGIPVTVWEPAPGKANLLARLKGTGERRPIVLLNHMDVVPASPEYWSVDPFGGVIRDGSVWGRGALDMKGLAIAQLMSVLAVKRSGVRRTRDLIFLATADEEIGGALGAGDVVANHLDWVRGAEFVINEGGDIALGSGGRVLYYGVGVTEKSPFWLDVIARGPGGHGSVPRQEAAPHRLVRALELIRNWETPVTVLPVVERYFRDIAITADPDLRPLFADIRRAVEDPASLATITRNPSHNALLRNTMSITVLSASEKINVVPAEARAELDVRLLPGQEPAAFLGALRGLVGDEAITIQPQGIGWAATGSPSDSGLLRAVETVARRNDPGAIITTLMLAGFTDCHYFRERGIACYGIDPFRVPEAESRAVHGNDERISIANLRFGTKFLYDVVRELSR